MDDNSPVRFWTPADALVYITKGTGPAFLVEDAIGIDLKIDSPKVPLYGYADRYWAALLPGHIIVYGNLYIAFRVPNYLSFINSEGSVEEETIRLTSTSDLGAAANKAALLNAIKDQLLSGSVTMDNQLLSVGAVAQKNGTKQAPLSYLLRQKYYGKQTVRDGSSIPTEGIIEASPKEQLSLRVTYGYEKRLSYQIENVNFNGSGQQFNILDGGGDHHILEVHSFVARRVVGTYNENNETASATE